LVLPAASGYVFQHARETPPTATPAPAPAPARLPSLPQGTVEYAVDRAALMKFFRPPVSESTFYKLQQDVYIVPVEGVSGRCYRLNISLARLGLNPVADVPADEDPRADRRPAAHRPPALLYCASCGFVKSAP